MIYNSKITAWNIKNSYQTWGIYCDYTTGALRLPRYVVEASNCDWVLCIHVVSGAFTHWGIPTIIHGI